MDPHVFAHQCNDIQHIREKESRDQRSTVDVPKLKSDNCEEYELWRNDVRWWQMLAKIPKNRQAPHLIINAIHVRSVHKIIREISHADAETDEGIDILLRNLDKHFMPNTFNRSWELCMEFRDLVKTEAHSWSEYVQKMKQLRAELAHQEMTMSNEFLVLT